MCESCSGVWVDLAEEKLVLEMKPDVFSVDELKFMRKAYEPYSKDDPVRYKECPVCHQLMQRKNWGSHSGVVVDKCYDHGTWYQSGEIEKIQDYIRLGGVEFEKMRMVQNGLDRLDQHLENTALRLDQKIDGAYRRARIFSWLGF